MKAKDIVLIVITLGLCVGLLSNMIWHYLPHNSYVVALITIFIVCILILIFRREGSTKTLLATLSRKIITSKNNGIRTEYNIRNRPALA